MNLEVKSDFLEALEDLTTNSRAIIKTLTEIAQENSDNALSVAQALTEHILKCDPKFKLPALYLLDSICKSMPAIYAPHFAPQILQIIISVFEISPEPVKVKISELFKTWTIASPITNKAIFPHEVLRSINEFLMAQVQRVAQPPILTPAPMPGRPRLNQSALMVDLNRYRTLLEEDEPSNFKDTQMSILARLEATLSGVIDIKILPDVFDELNAMKYNRDQFLQSRQFEKPKKRRTNNNSNHQYSNPNSRNEGRDKKMQDHRRITKPSTTTATSTGTSTGTTTGTLSGTTTKQNSQLQDYNIPQLGKDVFKDTLLSLKTASQTDATPEQLSSLYEDLSLQCSTCGYRFPNTEEGHKAEDNELDWHFRANKDIRENHSRNRCWYLTIGLFIDYREENELHDVYSNTTEMVTDEKQTTVETIDQLKQKFIEIPVDTDGVCPVCQESFETSWSDEVENWVWTNAVSVSGHCFHATCYADPRNKKLVESITH